MWPNWLKGKFRIKDKKHYYPWGISKKNLQFPNVLSFKINSAKRILKSAAEKTEMTSASTKNESFKSSVHIHTRTSYMERIVKIQMILNKYPIVEVLFIKTFRRWFCRIFKRRIIKHWERNADYKSALKLHLEREKTKAINETLTSPDLDAVTSFSWRT